MAHPKRRHSKSRRDMARAHKKLVPTGLKKCSHCGKAILPHTVCAWCGYYKDRQVLVLVSKEAEDKKKKQG